jgi:peptidoglycan/xylan/chitin deacetylase (PgdA/CDA1 family)
VAFVLQVPVLMYHEIAQPWETASRLAVTPSDWAEQLAYLHGEGFRTITAAELSQAVSGVGKLPDHAVVLTFDDGYADFHSRALPTLDRFGFTATLFVTTGWIQDAEGLSRGHRPGIMLSWSQIVEAAHAGIEIAAHSRLHPQLDQLPGTLLREELHSSRAELENKLGSAVTGLAYPFGYSNARVRQRAQDLGYDYACAVGNVMINEKSDQFALPRLSIMKDTSMPMFRHIVRGSKIRSIYFKERGLTKGWAMVRRTKAALGSVSRRE